MRDLLLLLDGVEAPNLTALSLTDNGEDDEEVEHESVSSTAYPLFNGPSSVPKLQTLDFWAIPLKWEPCPFGNLLNLELSRLPEGACPVIGGRPRPDTRFQQVALRQQHSLISSTHRPLWSP